jgi:PAS domain S-box-containing protein
MIFIIGSILNDLLLWSGEQLSTGLSASVAAPEPQESLHLIKNAFTIVLFLLGVAMAIFIYFNLRNNRKRKPTHLFSGIDNQSENKEPDKKVQNTTILDAFPVPTCICKGDGTITYSNTAFATVFGSLPGHMKSLSLFNILPAHITSFISFENDEPLSSPNGFYSPNTKTRYLVNWQKNTKNGTQKSFLITLEKMVEVEHMDQHLEKSKLLIRSILDHLPYPIIIEDKGGCILEINKPACIMHGMERESLIGRKISDLSPDDLEEEISARQQSLSNQNGVCFRSVTYPQNGQPLPVEIQVQKTDYFGIPALFLTLKDLTESIEKKKELDEFKIKAEESDRLKSSFLSNLSHEVRTPMNTIMGFAELLAEAEIDAKERKEFIRLIRHSGKELINQINNMIDFAKIEAGLINLKVEICDYETLFHRLHEYATEEIGTEKDIKLFFELPPELIKNAIATDISRLKQILKIFLSNALKYTTSGVIEIGVRTKAPQLYEFYVRDTGFGIAEEKHRQIFEKFRQVNDTYSREFSGMGLGLSIASRLIQFLGGHQWVISEPGKGSEFRCAIPDLLFPTGSPVLQVSCGPSTVINKVMIVSPTDTIYQELCHDSKPVNYQIFWAQNAQEMKSMLLSNNIKYLLIAVDQLPFWQELLNKIRSIDAKVQLIGISDQLDIRRKARLISMGLNDAIKTPVSIPVLLNILERNDYMALHVLTTSFNQN